MENKITLYTETVIDSAHQLRNYDGKCKHIHGHSWWLRVWIQGTDEQKDSVGILFDFGNIKKIQEELDHKFINDIHPFNSVIEVNPTAENLTLYILNNLLEINPQLEYRVRLYETAVLKKTYCQRQTQNFDIQYL